MPSHLQLLMLVLGALPSLTHAECNNPGDYIMLDFNTSLVRSNLGGQGGRCTELGACDELQTTSTPHEPISLGREAIVAVMKADLPP